MLRVWAWRPSISMLPGLKSERLNSKKFELDSVGEGVHRGFVRQ